MVSALKSVSIISVAISSLNSIDVVLSDVVGDGIVVSSSLASIGRVSLGVTVCSS